MSSLLRTRNEILIFLSYIRRILLDQMAYLSI